ncbi:MAG: ribosome maturation factor RimP [Lachnospiraceae bacterium]|nr:ribosome maturation factor RimP [Lachnospiraceae bacterium]
MEENGFEMVDVEYVKEGRNYYLRAYIDKPGGITIDDCELVSRALEAKLDAEDLIPEAYILEVSSPGLGRALKKDRDFARSLGEEVEVHLFAAEQKGMGKDFVGVLAGYDADSVTIEVDEEEKIIFQRKNIASIRLTFDF